MPCKKFLSELIHTPQTLRATNYDTWRTSTSCPTMTRTSEDARAFPVEEYNSSGVIVFKNAIDTESIDILRGMASHNTFPQRFLCGQSNPSEFTDSNCLHDVRGIAFDHFVSQVHRVLAPLDLQLHGICEIVRINAHTKQPTQSPSCGHRPVTRDITHIHMHIQIYTPSPYFLQEAAYHASVSD